MIVENFDGGITPILRLTQFPLHSFKIFGRGAHSIDTMSATIKPIQSEIYFRIVNIRNRTFKCVHGQVSQNWQPGDSGTWCWTEEGQIVGMGMAYAHIEGNHYCCILPIENVVSAIHQLTETIGK